MVLANRNTSHVLIEKCCSILGAQGMPSVPAYLELVGSQLHMSCRCFLSASAVLPDVTKVLRLSATDCLTYYLVTFLSLQQTQNKMKAHQTCSEKLVFNQGACRCCVHMYNLSSQHFLMCPIFPAHYCHNLTAVSSNSCRWDVTWLTSFMLNLFLCSQQACVLLSCE